jgi:dynein light chain roadblock-type
MNRRPLTTLDPSQSVARLPVRCRRLLGRAPCAIHSPAFSSRQQTAMSEVEETLERIKNHKGVEGYVIADRSGNVLRRHPMMAVAEAEKYAQYMKELTTKARGVVRDLNPKNDLQYMRIRVKKLELLVAHGRHGYSELAVSIGEDDADNTHASSCPWQSETFRSSSSRSGLRATASVGTTS